MESRISNNPSQYRLIRSLGEGLTSCVYKAIRESEGPNIERVVALKILKLETDVDKWRHEVHALSTVRSPYCVSFYGWETFGDKMGIVLEYIDGLNLSELLKLKELTRAQVLEICRQGQLGLSDLSQFQIFHGDISPNNLIIDRNGRVRWIDFGLGHIESHHKQVTVEFAAPELLMGASASYESDLFGLGMLCASLGDKKVLSRELKTLMHPVVHKRTPAPIEVNRVAQRELGKLIDWAIEEKRRSSTQTIARVQHQPEIKKSRSFGQLLGKVTLAASLCFVLGFVPTATPSPVTGKILGVVSMSTKNWVQVWVDGQLWGYTPIVQRALGIGPHELRWKSATGEGQRTLTIGKGNHIVIKDQFFQAQE